MTTTEQRKKLPKYITEGLDQRKIAWYLQMIEEGYTQGQLADYEDTFPQTIFNRIKNFEGIYIQAPAKGSRVRRVESEDVITSSN